MGYLVTGAVVMTSVDVSKIVKSAEAHKPGERFSGWTPSYDVNETGVTEVLDCIAAYALPGYLRYPEGTWVNVLKGIGAEVEEHDEGYNPGDWTILVFLTTLNEGDGGELVIDGTSVRPVVGRWVAFGSEQRHRVNPMKTNLVRISAAAIYHT